MAERRPEKRPFNIVLGLAGPYGAGSSSLAQELQDVIDDWPGCRAEVIPVSTLIEATSRRFGNPEPPSVSPSSPARRRLLQKAGTALRKKHLRAVGYSIAVEIYERGRQLENDGELDDTRILFFLIDSLKNSHDVATLREIYGDEFFMLFVSADRDTRWRREKDYKGWQERDRKQFDELDAVDGNESAVHPGVGKAGQQVGKLGVMADYYIVNDRNREELHEAGSRIIHMLIGNGRNQPTLHERAMHLAYSASLRSYCLSRQVGAAIVDASGNVISVGHNDVPKAGGALYTQEDQEDGDDRRCYQTGDRRCINDTNKQERFDKLINDLCATPEFKKHKRKLTKIVEASSFRDATEYCRAVHAEMEALIACSRTGARSPSGGTLYVTTKPCHNCTKHILCAGLSRVVYIEPYEKSLAEELHSDAILFDPPSADSCSDKLVVVPYEGVAPRRYADFFAMDADRKDERGYYAHKSKESRAEDPRVGSRLQRRHRNKPFDAITVKELETVKALAALMPKSNERKRT